MQLGFLEGLDLDSRVSSRQTRFPVKSCREFRSLGQLIYSPTKNTASFQSAMRKAAKGIGICTTVTLVDMTHSHRNWRLSSDA